MAFFCHRQQTFTSKLPTVLSVAFSLSLGTLLATLQSIGTHLAIKEAMNGLAIKQAMSILAILQAVDTLPATHHAF